LEGVCAGLLWKGLCRKETEASMTGNGRSAKVQGGGGLGRECQSTAGSPQVAPFFMLGGRGEK